MTGACLIYANLSGANFTDADLRNADLSGADLTGTNLSGANLTGVKWEVALLDGVKLWNTTMPNGKLVSGIKYLE